MSNSFFLITVIITSALFIMIGMVTLGTFDNTFSCSAINNTQGQTGCTNTKTATWNVYMLVPIALLFIVLGLFGISGRH